MNNPKRLCKKCSQPNLMIRGTQLVCLVCGNAEQGQGSNVFSTEYQHTQMRRTTKYIKEKQQKDAPQKNREPIQVHLEKNWGQYILGFQRCLMELAEMAQTQYQITGHYKAQVKEVWFDYLGLWIKFGQPLRSNWTIARKGHQQPLQISRYIPNKYGKSKDYDFFEMIEQTRYQEEKTNTGRDDGFSQTMASTLELDQQQNDQSQSQSGKASRSASQSGDQRMNKKKRTKRSKKIIPELKKKRIPQKKEKSYFYARRSLKKQMIEGRKESDIQLRRRGSTSKRKSSVSCNDLQQFVDNLSNLRNNPKWDQLKSVLKQTVQITDLEYATIVEVYFENSTSNHQSQGMIGSIKKIKNITSLSKQSHKLLIQSGFTQSEAECLTPYYQKEAYLLKDFLAIMTDSEQVIQSYQSVHQLPRSSVVEQHQLSPTSIIYFSRRADQLLDYLVRVTKQLQERKSLDSTLNRVRDKQFKPQTTPPTIDFYLIPVILLEASFKTETPILPRNLYASMRQGKLPFMTGFTSKMDSEICRDYLTVPTNIPSTQYLRDKLRQRVTQNHVPFYIEEISNLLNFDGQILEQSLKLNILLTKMIKYKLHQQDQYSLALILVSFQLSFGEQWCAIKPYQEYLTQQLQEEMSKMVMINHRDLKYKSYDRLLSSLQEWANQQDETLINDRKHDQMNAYFDRFQGYDEEFDQQRQFQQIQVKENCMFQQYMETLQEYFYEDMSQVLVFKKQIERVLLNFD